MIRIWLVLTIVIAGIMVLSACAAPAESPPTSVPSEPAAEPPPGNLLAHSGRLYDKWWKEIGIDAPSGDNPVWALQSTNTRSGDTTWRCKECHGWDYKGKDGAYSKGSHYTGFPGLMNASDMADDQLLSIMRGAHNSDHAFSELLTDLHTEHIVLFLKWGMIDDSKYIDYSTKKAIGADIAHGEELYTSTCVACHGADGKTIDFGDGDGIGALSNGNPWETLHKIRFGQPDSSMPAGVANGWSTEDAVDVLGYAQTLPE